MRRPGESHEAQDGKKNAEVPIKFEQNKHGLTTFLLQIGAHRAWRIESGLIATKTQAKAMLFFSVLRLCGSRQVVAQCCADERFTGESHAGSIPTISFDYFFTKSDRQGQECDPNTITALIVVDSHTNFVTYIPLEKKVQLDHVNREIINAWILRGDFAL